MKKRTVHTMLSVMTIVIGLLLMMGKIYADSEPGFIPILLVALGVGWYSVARVRTRSDLR